MIQGVGTAAIGTAAAADEARSAISQGDLDTATAEYNARQAGIRGGRAAQKARMEGSALIARQKVAYANSGVDTKSGTPLQVMANTGAQSELDALTLENDAAREAWGYRLMGVQAQENKRSRLAGAQRSQYGSVLSGIGQFGQGAVQAGKDFG